MVPEFWRRGLVLGAVVGALAILATACGGGGGEVQVKEVTRIVEKEVTRVVEVPSGGAAPATLPPPGTYKWKMYLPFSGLWSVNQYPQLVQDIKDRTQGALEIELFLPGEHPYAFTDILDAVNKGDAQMGEVLGSYSSGLDARLAILDLPMFPPTNDWPTYYKVLDTLENKILNDVMAEWNQQIVLGYSWPSQRLHTKSECVELNCLKGQKIRTYSLELTQFVGILGGEGVTIAWNEVPTALATGVVDGGITGTGPAKLAGWYDYVTWNNQWEIMGATSWLTVNKDAFAELDDATKKAFLEVMAEWEPFLRYGTQWDDGLSTQELVIEWGASLAKPTDETRNAVREKARTVIWQPWQDRGGEQGAAAFQLADDLITELTSQ